MLRATMDHRSDAEMMDTETQTTEAEAAQPEELPSNATNNSTNNQSNGVWDLLTLARQLINQGKPSQALQAVKFFTFK